LVNNGVLAAREFGKSGGKGLNEDGGFSG